MAMPMYNLIEYSDNYCEIEMKKWKNEIIYFYSCAVENYTQLYKKKKFKKLQIFLI